MLPPTPRNSPLSFDLVVIPEIAIRAHTSILAARRNVAAAIGLANAGPGQLQRIHEIFRNEESADLGFVAKNAPARVAESATHPRAREIFRVGVLGELGFST